MEKLKVLDLFSGIGGFSLGLERTGGFETVAFCEIDPYCRKVLAKHWPDIPCHDDITTREFKEGEADVITAGFPCQDISLAGRGAGIAGERSGLWREVVRAVRLVRPRLVLLENVSALLGRGLGTVLGDLSALGYDAEWHCIPASAVGAPHRRDRIWIVAYPGGEQHQGRSAQIGREIASELSCASLADADRPGPQGRNGGELPECAGERAAGPCGASLADAKGAVCTRLGPEPRRKQRRPADEGWWLTEPDVGRVAHGVPARVDRLRSLGNAVVPQIPELIGRAILASQEKGGA